MCTVLLPPGDNPFAVNKYIISYINKVVFDITLLVFIIVCSTTEMSHLKVVLKYVQTSRRHTPGNHYLQINVYSVFSILLHVFQAYRPATSSRCCMTRDVFGILKEGMLQRYVLFYRLPDGVTAVVRVVPFSLAHLSARKTG